MEDHFEDDLNENCEIEVEVGTKNDLKLEIPSKKVEANEAVAVFNKALEWAESECIDQNGINVFRRLRKKALLQILEKRKQQKKN